MLEQDTYIASATPHSKQTVTALSHTSIMQTFVFWLFCEKLPCGLQKSCKILMSCALLCKICCCPWPVTKGQVGNASPVSLCYCLCICVHRKVLNPITNFIFSISPKFFCGYSCCFSHISLTLKLSILSSALYCNTSAVARARTWTAPKS